ncbi:PadR family transcriptional regulator [Xanthobacter sp. DSM 24535]|uniref:PadR family transcriptional regulator n=1 Tax=Roseixanthobacter psychrophilus TaxID=3119917 RepID=UPI00372A0B99
MFGCRHHGEGRRFAMARGDEEGGWGRGGGHGRGGRGGGDMFRLGRMLAQGDLKLLALALIAEQPRHGYELIKLIEEKTAGWYLPSPGIVYPTLTFLEEAGYVVAQSEGAKKRYAITPEGETYLAQNRDFADALLGRLAEIGNKMSRFRRWVGRGEGDGPAQPELPRLVEAALDNLRDVSGKQLEANRGAETRIVEILARAAADIREA